MDEVGLELRIRGGKVCLSYRTLDYEIRSSKAGPCNYICQGDEVLHTLHDGFETSLIEKMIMRGKQFPASNGKMVGFELLREVFAAMLDQGSPEQEFDDAYQLAVMRRDHRAEYQQQLDNLHHAERLVRLAQVTPTKDLRGLPKYIYRGEIERDFYLAFTKAHELNEYHIRKGAEEAEEPAEPLGVIIVPKDYDSTWISYLRFYLDWKVIIAPVSARFVKGFKDPHWQVLEDHTDAELSGYKYVVYQAPDGSIVADTCHSTLDIADTFDAYRRMDPLEVRFMCYCSEMGRAR